jgi:hypothetical protein
VEPRQASAQHAHYTSTNYRTQTNAQLVLVVLLANSGMDVLEAVKEHVNHAPSVHTKTLTTLANKAIVNRQHRAKLVSEENIDPPLAQLLRHNA